MPLSKQGRPARASAGFRVRPLLGALVAAGVIAPTSLHAATIPVTTGGDAGNAGTCTLRQAADSLNTAALVASCTNPSAVAFGTNDTIDLTGRTGTITLAGSAIPLLVSTVINGPGATGLTISGGGASRVLDAGTNGLQVDISDVTIANGRSAGPGGCIYGAQTEFQLFDAVVTGCRADHDPTGMTVLNGLGGGLFAYVVDLQNTTVSGNIAQTAGGGLFAIYAFAYRSAVTGNTVTGHTCNVEATPDKYCLPAAFGGGGVVGVATTSFVESTVSGNTLNASTFTEDGGFAYRFGFGGGITHFGKYGGGPDMTLAGTGKSTVTGTRALFRGAGPSTFAAAKAKSAQRLATLPAAKAKLRSKADGLGSERLGLLGTTLSGNRILGGGGNPEVAKYSGGGAAFFSEYENGEFANSTVSGNSIPNGLPCNTYGEPPVRFSCGAGLLGDSFELTNSTVTGNVGATAVHSKYNLSTVVEQQKLAVKFAKAAEKRPTLLRWKQRWQQQANASSGARGKAVAKASSPPVMDSTIVAGNSGTYDIACTSDCTISGANNLVRTRQSTVTFVNAPNNANPNLAPLANNGGVIAGAPGVAGTGPVRTHALYVGSPAINAGSNIEGFEYDQRGPGFPRQVGAAVDIGAFEGAIAAPQGAPVPALGAAQLALLAGMLAASAAYLRRRRTH